ncbi:MAG: triose-phosphate isomerase [Bacteroidota bacterium]
MRKKIAAGNWKMNESLDEGINLINNILILTASKDEYFKEHNVQILLFPPFIHLSLLETVLAENQHIAFGAQNCSWADKGAYTGEVSAAMIHSTGAEYVIIGHSERRQYFSETDRILSEKTQIALKNHLCPVFCCGEVLAEREKGEQFAIVESQLSEAIFHFEVEDFEKIIIAYEPVWAIGTGVTASPEQAQEMHAFIRSLIAKKYNKEVADNTSILYGGSCNAANAKLLFFMPDVDGGLVGGASLIAEDFFTISTSF